MADPRHPLPPFSPTPHLWQGSRGACAHVLVDQALEWLRQQPGCVQHQAGGRADLGQHLHLEGGRTGSEGGWEGQQAGISSTRRGGVLTSASISTWGE